MITKLMGEGGGEALAVGPLVKELFCGFPSHYDVTDPYPTNLPFNPSAAQSTSMVLIVDGNSEIGAHIRSNL